MFEYALFKQCIFIGSGKSVGNQFERPKAAVELGVLVGRLLKDDIGQLLVLNLAVFLDSLIDVVEVNNMILDSVLKKNFFLLGIGRKLGRIQVE